jgi:ABC-type amino acid transport substrate-binding protein
MKKILGTLVLLLSLAVSAQIPNSTIPLTKELADIKKRNVLVVAMNKKDNPPFYSGEGDSLRGIDVDIARRVAKVLGVPVEFRRDAESFAEVVEQIRAGKADMAASKLSVTDPRLLTVRFSTPYVKLKQAMMVNRLWLSQNSNGREVYQVIREFDGRLSFIKNSSYDTFARINFPKALYVPETDWTIIINKVTEGSVSAAYRDEFEIKKILFERPEAAISTKTVTISDSFDNIAVAVRPDSVHLLDIVNYVIANDFNNIDVKKLMARYQADISKK